MPERKIRIGVLFGGRSAEHEVSLVSAASIINALDTSKYDVIPIGITPEGRWLSAANALALLKEKSGVDNLPEHLIVPDPRRQGLLGIHNASSSNVENQAEGMEVKPLDVVFPVLHGTYGEDGTIQGLLELADVAYVGAGVLGSAVGMDKVIQKQLLENAGISIAPYSFFLMNEFEANEKDMINSIEKKLHYPCFVKPAHTGSSVGISKAHGRKELIAAVQLASQYDRKILVEKSIERAREIECSVLGNDEPVASVPGEIISSNEFYDYDAKYVDGKSTAIIPAKFSKAVTKKIQQIAASAFTILDCAGMARVDFLVQRNGEKIYLNEINTIPGFTSISMYPKLWEASGVKYSDLLDRLVQLALERHAEKQTLKTTFKPKNEWYR
ncbi:MAG: D-alanine--D-alanine ligase [Bacteroidota bacterium]|nr:D-alanine--D-alanine ligase [Bacteroidota bacterium]